ncbi:MAG: deoxyribonuclease IV [Promethearchaeota archaeon]
MKIGAHVSATGYYYNGIRAGVDLGCEAVQIFTSSPRRWAFRAWKPGEVGKFVEEREKSGLTHAFSHANYLINMAAPEGPQREKSRNAMLEELVRVERLGMDFVVVHPGSFKGLVEAGIPKEEAPAKAVELIGELLTWVFERRPEGTGQILLENTAGGGTLVGKTFEGLAAILEAVPSRYRARVGTCFDTCHAYASGYDLRTEKAYEETMGALDDAVGLVRVLAFHLNDSAYPLGSHRDEHADIGAGELGERAFDLLLNDPRFEGRPGVLETHYTKGYDEHRRNLAKLFSLRRN